ncbi:MAG: WD40 repeat domain-containing protein [Chloroflexota bacterium]
MTFETITARNATRLHVVQRAARGWISEVTLSPDGRLLAASSAGGVGIWRGSLESKPLFMKPHDGPVKGIAFAPNGVTFVTGSADTRVKTWDLRAFSPSMQPIEIYTNHEDSVEDVVIAANGTVISASVDRTVRMLHPRGSMVLTGHTDEVNTLAVNHYLIASGGHDNMVRLWDIKSGESVAALKGHNDWVRRVQFHPKDDGVLLSAGRDGTVRLWDIRNATRPTQTAAFYHEGDVRAATFDATGDLIFAGSTSGNVAVWEVATGQRVAVLEHHNKPIISMILHPRNNFLITGGGDNDIALWVIQVLH